jgi:glycosyltransferase involved in cell wall biosynthesis
MPLYERCSTRTDMPPRSSHDDNLRSGPRLRSRSEVTSLPHPDPMPGSGPATCVPWISVVVPTCGRPALLNRCLTGLTGQDLAPANYEIVVVDDRPSSATRGIVQQWADAQDKRGLVIRYVASTGPHGPAAARNRGWRQARADVIAFTDDDTEPDSGWLRNGLKAFQVQEPGTEAVTGRIVMPIPPDPTDYERDANGLERAEFATANCFCRRRILERIDGFDERFELAWREDSDLQFRILSTGARIGYAKEAVVLHPVRPAPWGVSVKQQKKVMFDALLYKKHPGLYRERIRGAPRWDYYAIVALLILGVGGLAAGKPAWSLLWLTGWAGLTARFCLQRLRGTSRDPMHVLEMMLTSALIPPLAVFWRLAGSLKFRVGFA